MRNTGRFLLFALIAGVSLVNVDAFAQTGACCQQDGDCIDVVSQSACNFVNGTWHGLGTECCTVSIPCTATCGACCSPNGSCRIENEFQCVGGGQVFRGPGTTCAPNQCVQPGACCLPSGACIMAVQVGGADCTSAGGVYHGDGTTCGQVFCPQPGACCAADGTCTLASQIGGANCTSSGRTYLGDGTICSAGVCLGGCCLSTGLCQTESATSCQQLGGDFLGIGSPCVQNACLGACCELTGACSIRVRSECESVGGAFQGPGTECGIAGCSVVWDNGPLATGMAAGACGGQQSLLQNTSMCLTNFGYNAASESSARLADDFVLTRRTMIASLVLYGYETNASAVSITAASATIHSAQPSTVGEHAIFTTTSALQPAGFTDVYRQSEGDTGCTRRIQRIILNLNNIALNPGTYWVSFQLTGGALIGPFVPPVTILGAPGKPGANAIFSSSGGAFQAALDAGAQGCTPAPPTPNPQDFVFVVEGRLDLVRPCCNTNGSCSMVLESACVAAGGNPGPIGSTCNDPADFDSDGNPDVCDPDDDADGVPDAIDVCPRNGLQLATDAVSGRPLGDITGDCITNGDDIAGFVQQLLAGN